jgi:hypothetical protein
MPVQCWATETKVPMRQQGEEVCQEILSILSNEPNTDARKTHT